MKLSNINRYILGIPKTILINFKCLPISQAIKLPIIVSHKVLLKEIYGDIEINEKIKMGMIRIGFGDIGIFDKSLSRSIFKNSGKIIFNGKCRIGHGSKLSVNRNAVITFGKDFSISAETSIVCNKKISIGNNVLISWDCLLMDTDFHNIYNIEDYIINKDKDIIIGNNVWIGCRNTLLKGTKINDDVVIAANSTICNDFLHEGKNIIIGGNPAKVLKRNIYWNR